MRLDFFSMHAWENRAKKPNKGRKDIAILNVLQNTKISAQNKTW